MDKQKKYSIFDDEQEPEYTLRVTSNENIKKVCIVLASTEGKPQDERLYYARHGEIEPDHFNEDGNAVYRFPNDYTLSTMFAGLAQVLFYGAPTLGHVDNEEGFVIDDEKKWAKLIRSEVREALDDFLGEFGVSPYEVVDVLNMLNQNPNLENSLSKNMEEAASKADTKQSENDTKTPSETGVPAS